MPHNMRLLEASLDGGFGQPVFEAQATFRLMMDAMARPGSVRHVEADVAAPGLAGPAQAALALTLCDASTPVWRLGTPSELGAWFAFHTGAPLTKNPSEATFAFLDQGEAILAEFQLGTQDYPDRSATLIIEVRRFGKGERFSLAGPGIASHCDLTVDGLPEGFVAFRAANRALFPRGLDVVLTAGRDLVALPRSTHFLPSEG